MALPEPIPVEPRRQDGAADVESLVDLGLVEPPPEPAAPQAPAEEPA